MLTESEVIFIKDLLEQLSSAADPSEYTQEEVNLALELLNKLQPISTDRYFDLLDDPDRLED